MRPRLLKLKGFTSFRDDQELDFQDLDVFAITGPTGAGKSSLLDAITYALYGRVERVSNECSQLISHGLNRMAVTLDFDVNGKQYRVTRVTPSKGATKVGLERIDDGEARSYGEGADRVRECDKMIVELLGLDYAGFTRSVLLPQGKFAEFMVGDPKERREILSELLGLGLFQRMAKTAGRRATESESVATTKHDLVQSEYAEVTAEALEAARQRAKDAQGRVAQLELAAKEVDKLAERWRAEQARASELNSCAVDMHDWVRRLDAALGAVERLGTELEQHEIKQAESTAAAGETERVAVLARVERETAETAWGTALELAGVQPTARRLPALRQQIASLEVQLGHVAERSPRLQTELEGQQTTLVSATDTVAEAEGALGAAQQRERDVEHADMAATLAHDLSIGDPCPVCGEPLAKLPERPGAGALTAAKTATVSAQQILNGAQTALRDVERRIEKTERDIQDAHTEHERHTDQLATTRLEFEAADQAVRSALRGFDTDHPSSVLQQRIDQLAGFEERERKAAQHSQEIARKHQEVVHAGELLLERLNQQRLALEDPGLLLVTRASGFKIRLDLPPAPATDATPPDLLAFGRLKSTAIASSAATLLSQAQVAAAAEAALLQQAHAKTGDMVEPAKTLVALLQNVATARTEAAGAHATASQQAKALEIRLEHRRVLEGEIKQLREQSGRYQELATDLRADRLIAFLQDEALKLLAAAGSAHLLGLSGGRYTLRYNRDFFVVDTWNGDEERNVRTLSGGETFLASLALALALSEQVRTLSITERARLDSLFLDEGFGSLDPDTLAVVTEAIEHLGGDGRLVGVITHVRDLADNFPRIEVEKSTRGSRLRRVVD